MYLVGFYSPKEKAGVTKMALSIFKQLKEYPSLSVAFVSNHRLEIEPITNGTVHLFADLSLNEQKKKIKTLKNDFDIVIYDTSSGLSEATLDLLPVVDRLFILGEDDTFFAQTLFSVISFNRSFEPKSKDLVNQLHNDGNYILHNDANQKVGFAKTTEDVGNICNIIYNDYSVYFLHNHYVNKSQTMIKKIKKIDKIDLYSGLYNLGLSFDKSVLLHKYILLREALGQPYEKAIESLFPFFIRHEYTDILSRFDSELRVAQIQFDHPNEEELSEE